ncbi:bifunctional glycosyltransferase family 2 protein/CDP-glycerol:glycerophosphate glycerophosphotransferase [Streptomyces sp. KAU_LT]|uniref:bifunctional glycosyltransferase/CDP-glycerol:glycerophosphate glycerophosphotransferase n=1 Tax=Streptomyces sp. KAU_LT TaxID=3046669 RepID=UPI0024B70D6D|nr:bifunctional glycosyltransferase family 2 protein/CDP-glycerol:glycerophosphate glycerophosphotransferase [Streptomyces sp. KAU_LT]MDI9836448.1 bifunctional glycosyltransferase family 2 protein/CDP-glycerol:glycerophosphate glycerophosphotransferase [Streptomyces sp. KAU_LT]
MPRFSVIVPAYKVQAYLHECLESVLTQSYPDLELIAVDDCSPDACGAIIDEFAARDPRVRAVHLPRNRGLGPARNAGMAEATGDYLLFLDSDDTLTPDSLQAIAGRLKETGEPDVLVYDYARTFWTGETVRNQAAAHLAEEGPAPFRLTDRPGLLGLLMVAWNKAYRREFVEAEELVFPTGYYEDTPWTYPVLMSAGSIATLDRVCVHYRQRRHGGILGTVSPRHFDVFEQYDRVFAYVDKRPELARWRPLLFRRMVDHLVVVFARRDRLPRRSRAEFLRKARTYYRRYHCPAGPLPPRVRLHHALVRMGLHRTYQVLRCTAAVLRRAARTAVRLRRALRAGALRLHYRVQRCLPVRADRAVFAAHGVPGHGCHPGALERAFRAHAPHIRTAWVTGAGERDALPSGVRPLCPDTAAYWTALARSRYLVHNAAFDRRLVKRSGQVLVQTRRGTPFQRTGLDLRGRPGADPDVDGLLADVDTWDYLVSPSRYATLTWERAFPGAYTVLEYGSPRADVFRRATPADTVRVRGELGVPEDAVVILYAPTARAYRRAPVDLHRVACRLGPRHIVLARAPHGHDGPLAAPSDRVLDVTGHPGVEELCLASDALVTDYSSLMADYVCLDRPVVLLTDDWEAHEAVRGTYLDLRACPPGAVARDEDELIDIFTSGHWRGSRSAELRAAFRRRFCPHDDGRAAERVVRHVVLGEPDSPPVVASDRRPVPPPAEPRPRAPLGVVPRPASPRAVTESR